MNEFMPPARHKMRKCENEAHLLRLFCRTASQEIFTYKFIYFFIEFAQQRKFYYILLYLEYKKVKMNVAL
jgi:hypothetical protein